MCVRFIPVFFFYQYPPDLIQIELDKALTSRTLYIVVTERFWFMFDVISKFISLWTNYCYFKNLWAQVTDWGNEWVRVCLSLVINQCFLLIKKSKNIANMNCRIVGEGDEVDALDDFPWDTFIIETQSR